jgi:hypothetical protein
VLEAEKKKKKFILLVVNKDTGRVSDSHVAEMKKISFIYLVECVEIFQTKLSLVFVYEFCPKGNLLSFVEKYEQGNVKFTEEV